MHDAVLIVSKKRDYISNQPFNSYIKSHPEALNRFGIDHERFTYRHQGLDQRLTGVEPAKLVKPILA